MHQMFCPIFERFQPRSTSLDQYLKHKKCFSKLLRYQITFECKNVEEIKITFECQMIRSNPIQGSFINYVTQLGGGGSHFCDTMYKGFNCFERQVNGDAIFRQILNWLNGHAQTKSSSTSCSLIIQICQLVSFLETLLAFWSLPSLTPTI